MITLNPQIPVMISITPIDFRAGINRLAAIAESVFDAESRSGAIFVFRNKRCTDIKLIVYDGNGFFLGHKRLSKGKLSWWPRSERERLSITARELSKLLQGVDPRGTFHPDLVWDKRRLTSKRFWNEQASS